MDSTAIDGIIRAVVGGVATYYGTYNGFKWQEKGLNKQKDEQKKQAFDIIDTFIRDELIYNMKNIESKNIKLSEIV